MIERHFFLNFQKKVETTRAYLCVDLNDRFVVEPISRLSIKRVLFETYEAVKRKSWLRMEQVVSKANQEKIPNSRPIVLALRPRELDAEGVLVRIHLARQRAIRICHYTVCTVQISENAGQQKTIERLADIVRREMQET